MPRRRSITTLRDTDTKRRSRRLAQADGENCSPPRSLSPSIFLDETLLRSFSQSSSSSSFRSSTSSSSSCSSASYSPAASSSSTSSSTSPPPSSSFCSSSSSSSPSSSLVVLTSATESDKARIDELLSAVAQMYYPPVCKYKYSKEPEPKWRSERSETEISTLELLMSPLRKKSALDDWTPKEIALFEAGITSLGKDFGAIHQLIKTKSSKEVVDFFYTWKQSSHYLMWKTMGKPVARAHQGKVDQWAALHAKLNGTEPGLRMLTTDQIQLAPPPLDAKSPLSPSIDSFAKPLLMPASVSAIASTSSLSLFDVFSHNSFNVTSESLSSTISSNPSSPCCSSSLSISADSIA